MQDVKSVAVEVSEMSVREHLDRILASQVFATSPRCREFLRFVVRETLTGHGDTIKERTIAMEVFGKDSNFEPGEDSVVRVKAREVRKKLAEYYEQNGEVDVRIQLPVGGYVPAFERKGQDAAGVVPLPVMPEAPEASRPSRRTVLWASITACAAAAAWPLVRYVEAERTPLNELWKPVFATHNPLFISIPLLRNDDGSVTERVGLGAATAADETTEFLGRNHYPYHVRFGSDLTYSQIREQPSLLLGGFSSTWTTRITNNLRFTMVPIGFEDGGAIRDNQTGNIYGPIDNHTGHPTEDYAMICRLFDKASGQIIMIAAGITTFGTESAARFFLRPELFSQLISNQKSDWTQKSFQAVIRLSVIDQTPSTPTLIARHFWR